MKTYVRPPILEAIVEIRVATPIDEATMTKVQKRLQERYPAPPQKTQNISVEITDTGANVRQQGTGFKILSGEGTFTVAVAANAIGTSRTPPYLGWEDFIAEVKANWADWKKSVGRRDIARIGVRYINRIDIPFSPTDEIELGAYINFGVQRPPIPGFGPMNQFAANVEIPMIGSPVKLILNSSPTPSPLLRTASFLLDLDLSIETGLPQNDDALTSPQLLGLQLAMILGTTSFF